MISDLKAKNYKKYYKTAAMFEKSLKQLNSNQKIKLNLFFESLGFTYNI